MGTHGKRKTQRKRGKGREKSRSSTNTMNDHMHWTRRSNAHTLDGKGRGRAEVNPPNIITKNDEDTWNNTNNVIMDKAITTVDDKWETPIYRHADIELYHTNTSRIKIPFGIHRHHHQSHHAVVADTPLHAMVMRETPHHTPHHHSTTTPPLHHSTPPPHHDDHPFIKNQQCVIIMIPKNMTT